MKNTNQLTNQNKHIILLFKQLVLLNFCEDNFFVQFLV
jgi:hypothetical protein